jgi:hypothetical protein
LARFERSTLPEHKGTRTVVLRFIKIITPAKCVIPLYDGKIVPPKEGELHQKFSTYPVVSKVWSRSLDIDTKKKMVRGFQLLWDT